MNFTKILIQLGSDPALIIEGHFKAEEVQPWIDHFYEQQRVISSDLLARFKEETAKLATAEAANQP